MGIAGQITHSRVVDAYTKVGEACRRRGKFLGMGGVYDEENARRYLRMGPQLVVAGGDHSYLMTGGSARTAFLREAAPRSDVVA
jgi:2-keto-3-deoxy-L-rhamnonate aldolase RhmA